MILNFKDRFKEQAYPVCKPYPHEPDLELGHNKKANAYRLYCKDCDQRGQEAIPHNALSDKEKDNATELVPQKN